MNFKKILCIYLTLFLVSSIFANSEFHNTNIKFEKKEEKNIIIVFDEKGLLEEQNKEMSKTSQISSSKLQKMNEEFNGDYKKNSKKLKYYI